MTASPARWSAYVLLAAAALLVVLGALGDAGGRVLAWPAAGLLAGAALRDLVLTPTLAADRAGVRVVSGVRRRYVPWSEVEALRLVTDRRTPLLELDLGETLVVLGRTRLGRPPADVLEELVALRAR